MNALDTTPEQAEILAQSLLDAFDTLTDDFYLILDDFHYASATVIQQLFAYLCANLSPHIHLIIASRSHPDFSLSRLKLEDSLLIIDSHDLRLPSSQLNELCQLLQQPQLTEKERIRNGNRSNYGRLADSSLYTVTYGKDTETV